MKDNGLKINSTDLERKPGQMELSIQVAMRWVKNTEKGSLYGNSF